MIGRQVSRYRVIERLGAGGMGVVYKAQDLELGRYVALKFLPAAMTGDPQVLERFLREARAAAALNHPHICTIYEVNGNTVEPFIAMEYLEGQTLRDRIHGVQLPQDLLLDLAIQLADAVAAAHDRHIVHRDIKPANIFVTKSDQVKILDFGLAKHVQAEGSDNEATQAGGDNQMTGAGTTVGTVSYMSPEQARGEDVDSRSDIFSLGAVLYEMATARLAFDGNTPAVIYNAILSLAPTRPDLINPNLSTELVRIISHCLEKNRDLRYQNAADLRSDLKRLKRDTESHLSISAASSAAQAQASRRWKPLAYVAAAVIVLAAGALLVPKLRTRGDVMKETDVILLTDFTNSTGDAMFDGTLKQALALKLEESTFLNIFPEQQIRETLAYMRRSPDEKLSSDTGREICERQNLKAMMNAEIASLGSQYVVTLIAVECNTGNVLARDQVQAARKEDVLKSVGEAAIHMREKLGESLPMIQKTNAPIEQATTSSLDALKAFSAAEVLRNRGSDLEAISLYQRALEIDPMFMVAEARLGVIENNAGHREESKRLISKAYELRERGSERERFYVTAHYQRTVEGNADKAIGTYKLWRQTYPRDYIPAVNLGNIYLGTGRLKEAAEQLEDSIKLTPSPTAFLNLTATYMALGETDKLVSILKIWRDKLPTDGSPHNGLANYYVTIGEYDQGLEESKRAVELEPSPAHYGGLIRSYICANKFEEAKATAEKAIADKKDDPDLHYYLMVIAWRNGDEAAIRRELEWWKGKDVEPFAIAFQGIRTAAEGRLREAEPLFRAVDVAGKANGSRDGLDFSRFRTTLAHIYSAYGNQAKANSMIAAALKGDHVRAVLIDAGATMAAAGDEAAVNSILLELKAKFPNDASVQKVVIPLIKAALSLHQKKPDEAIELMKGTAPYVDPAIHYLRGMALAQKGQHQEATAEFQKIGDRYGVALVTNAVVLQMAYLELARSEAALGETEKARQAYDTFFKFFKNPDPDIPVLIAAKAEYAKLR